MEKVNEKEEVAATLEVAKKTVEETPVVKMNTPVENPMDKIAREIKDCNISFGTAYNCLNLLDDYLASITSIETKTHAKFMGIGRSLSELINKADKLRNDIINKYVAKDEKGNNIIEEFEIALPVDAPEGMVPQKQKKFVYLDGKEQICSNELKEALEQLNFLQINKVPKSDYLKVYINPQNFKGLDLIAKFFVQ